MKIIETINHQIEKIKGNYEKEEKVEELIDYKLQWEKFSAECNRVNNLFQFDSKNTFQHITHLNHLEQIRFHLKKIIDNGLDSFDNYNNEHYVDLSDIRKKIREDLNERNN